MSNEIEVNEYVRTNNISRKEYLKKYDSNVGMHYMFKII